MKKILLTMVAALSMTAMMAQTNNNTERKAPKKMTHEEMTTQMASKLNLSDDQKTQVAALNKEYQDYLMPTPPQRPNGEKPNFNKGEGNDGQRPDMSQDGNNSGNQKSNMKKSGNKPGNNQNQAKRQEYEKKLKTILSDEQYENYQKMGPQGKDMASKGKKAQNKQKKTNKNQ